MSDDALKAIRAFADCAIAPNLVDSSFDLDAWLEEWLRRPQPALGGRLPANLLHDPEGQESVKRVLGAMISGAYQ